MKNFKRILASVLTVVMMATSINLSFAASTNFSDVDSNFSTAVNRLSSIDIIKGYEDGTFKPEGTITRAEAAAILVRMIGKEKLASYSTGMSQFSDMSGHWGNGYVNVSASAGIIKGYPDGTFGPENKVTYAEIVTMMVRALGAGEAVGAAGVWPNNYLNFAVIEGLTDDVAILPGAPATRGDVAKIANVTLDAEMWKATGYDSDGTRTYEKTDATNGGVKTLFEEKLELTKDEMFTVTESLGNGALDVNQFKAGIDTDDSGVIDAGEISTFTFVEGMEKSVLPGEEVDIWSNDDNEVVMIQHAEESDQDLIRFSDVTAVAASTVELKSADGTEKKHDLLAGTVYVIDGTVGVKADVDEDLDLSGKALTDKDGDVTHLYVTNYNQAMVVEEVTIDEDDKEYKIDADTDMPNSDSRLSYDLDTDVVYVINALGQEIKLSDIKAGDMVQYTNNNTYLLVYPSNIVEGTVDAEDAEIIGIDGEEYSINPNFEGGSLIDSINVDDEVKLFLDASGQISMLEKVVGGTASGDYGVIADMYDYTDEKGATKVKVELVNLTSGQLTGLKLFDAEETDAEGVVFAGEDFYNEGTETINNDAALLADGYADYVGKAVKYDIKSDKIILYAIDADEIAGVGVNTSDLDISKEKISISGANYYVDSENVTVLQATEIDSDNVLTLKEIKFSELKDTDNKEFIMVEFDEDKENAEIIYIPMTDSADAGNVVDTKQVLNKSNDDNLGVITNVKALTGDNYKVTVMTNEGSEFFYVNENEAEDISTTAFDGSTIDLDTSADWTKFEGLLVAFSSDESSYVTSENIQFSNAINSAKFYEVNSRNEVEMLNSSDLAIEFDAFMNMFILEADMTGANAVAAEGTVTLTPANLDDGDTVVISGTTFTYQSLDNAGANFTTTADLEADIDALANVSAVAAGDVITVTATTAGFAGNAITMTTTGAADEVTLSGATLEDGLDANYIVDDIAASTASSIAEVDSDETDYSDAHADEANTVYYYTVQVDEDGDLVDLDASDLAGTDVESIAIMTFDPNEF
ncbi:MAG: hypothetical protein A2Y22_08190 [Clostridiales bacterium GWD2_32_59]|nr:MAG: hypothetical protein A2Y22_08190 [Clostridiales bacterium GWD2_32_59]